MELFKVFITYIFDCFKFLFSSDIAFPFFMVFMIVALFLVLMRLFKR